MKKSIKIMLLGIVLILFGIFLRTLYIEHLSSSLAEFIYTATPIIGIVLALYGFIREYPEEDSTEKIYSILLKEKNAKENVLVCKKCGQEYKEGYTSCPWCGYKES